MPVSGLWRGEDGWGWVRARTVALEAVGVGCGLETELRAGCGQGGSRELGWHLQKGLGTPSRDPVDHGGQARPLLGRLCLSKQPPLLCPHAHPSSRPATKLARGSSQLVPHCQELNTPRPRHKKPEDKVCGSHRPRPTCTNGAEPTAHSHGTEPTARSPRPTAHGPRPTARSPRREAAAPLPHPRPVAAIPGLPVTGSPPCQATSHQPTKAVEAGGKQRCRKTFSLIGFVFLAGKRVSQKPHRPRCPCLIGHNGVTCAVLGPPWTCLLDGAPCAW